MAYCVHDELPGDCRICSETGDMMPGDTPAEALDPEYVAYPNDPGKQEAWQHGRASQERPQPHDPLHNARNCPECDHWLALKQHLPQPRIAVTVIGTNLVMDYGSEERARAAMDAGTWLDDLEAALSEDGGRISRGGWHYPHCWQYWVGDPERRSCICEPESDR